MKKLSALLLALLMVMTCFTGCFGKNNDAQTSDESQSVSDSVVSDSMDTSNDVTDDVTDYNGAEYTIDIELSESDPNAETNDVSTGDIADAVKELLGEGYLPSMTLDNEALEMVYGIKPEWIDNYYAETPMISFHIDTFIVVKASDGHADDVEKALNDYQEYTLENSLQYPANVPKLNAARIYRLGDYVFYIMLGAIPDEYRDDEEGAFDFCVENNQKVVDKINELLKK